MSQNEDHMEDTDGDSYQQVKQTLMERSKVCFVFPSNFCNFWMLFSDNFFGFFSPFWYGYDSVRRKWRKRRRCYPNKPFRRRRSYPNRRLRSLSRPKNTRGSLTRFASHFCQESNWFHVLFLPLRIWVFFPTYLGYPPAWSSWFRRILLPFRSEWVQWSE